LKLLIIDILQKKNAVNAHIYSPVCSVVNFLRQWLWLEGCSCRLHC